MAAIGTGLLNEVFGTVQNSVDGIPFGGSSLPETLSGSGAPGAPGSLSILGTLGGFGGFNASAGRQINFPTGVNPGATGADNVLAVFSIPANAFDGLGPGRGLNIDVTATIAANANAKALKIIFNATTAVVGATVTGGTTLANSGALGAAVTVVNLLAKVYKTGLAGSNTQVGWSPGVNTNIAQTVFVTTPAAIAAVESAPILLAITGNAGTAVTDIALNAVEITGMN